MCVSACVILNIVQALRFFAKRNQKGNIIMIRKILAVFLCALLVTALLPCAASAMRIQHNVTALNAHRALTNNNSTLTKNLEKLSSGYRINRAGDDAAGLAISERIRAQRNAAMQNSNGSEATQSNASIQNPTGSLTALARSSEATQRNATGEIPPLDAASTIGAASMAQNAILEKMQALVDAEELAHGINDSTNPDDYKKLGEVSLFSGRITENTLMFGISHDLGASGMMMEFDADGYAITGQLSTDGTFINASSNPQSIIIASNGVALSDQDGVADLSLLDAYGNPLASGRAEVLGNRLYAHAIEVSSGDIRLPVGSSVQMTANISKTVVDAPESLEDARDDIAAARAQLGAAQNRLERSLNAPSVAADDVTAAESRIPDVNLASEMMQYTRNNTLLQTSQAMLAQANAVPQGVLQLLQ